MRKIVKRLLEIQLPAGRSAFLWGPRKVGKSYWIHHQLLGSREARVIDLLETDTFAEYAARPALLRERFDGRFTVIDEVQKVPALLDEVHGLIEKRGASFLLTGSSARKLRKGHANMLGGRAWRYELGPLSCVEVEDFDLERSMRSGMIPLHFLSEDPARDLRGYVADYLKEEIAAEAMARSIPAFSEFLRSAAFTNGELLNYTNVAAESGVSAKVVRGYYEILEDTLLGMRLAPWMRSKKRRMIRTDKFYYFDVGLANHLAKRHPVIGSPDFGKSFEHFILNEILAYRRHISPDLDLHYWRTSTGQEVDFILGDMDAAIEAKGGSRIHDGDLKGLRALAEDVKVRRRILVSLEKHARTLDDGIEILPWRTFIEKLHAGEIVR